ncbi:MAG: SEL1-like repeat protein, partial [Magnetococcales bacterium]|nr:SEL1-like repeat protein [Magnetococcales bacterium]
MDQDDAAASPPAGGNGETPPPPAARDQDGGGAAKPPAWHVVLLRGEKILFVLETLGSGLPEEQSLYSYRTLILVVTDFACIMVSMVGEEFLATRYDFDQIASLEELFPLHLKLKTTRDAVHIRLAEHYEPSYVKDDLLPAVKARIVKGPKDRVLFLLRKWDAKGWLRPELLLRVSLAIFFLVVGGAGVRAYLKARSAAPAVQVQPVASAQTAAKLEGKKGEAPASAAGSAGDSNPVGKVMGAMVNTVASAVVSKMDPAAMGKLLQGVVQGMPPPTGAAGGASSGNPEQMLNNLAGSQGQSKLADLSQFEAPPQAGGTDLDRVAQSLGSPPAGGMDLQKIAGALDPSRTAALPLGEMGGQGGALPMLAPDGKLQVSGGPSGQVLSPSRQGEPAPATPAGDSGKGEKSAQIGQQEQGSEAGEKAGTTGQSGGEAAQGVSPSGTPAPAGPTTTSKSRKKVSTTAVPPSFSGRQTDKVVPAGDSPGDTAAQGQDADQSSPVSRKDAPARIKNSDKHEVAQTPVVPLDDYRRLYPGLYDHLTDQELAAGLYRRYYTSMPRATYFSQLGLDPKNSGRFFTSLRDYRARFPGTYDDLTDVELADELWKKYYPEMTRAAFFAQVGVEDPRDLFVARDLSTDLQSANDLLAEGRRQRAFRLFLRLAQRGSVTAQTTLGYLFANGIGTLANRGRSVHWYRKAAAQGDVTAQYNLGQQLADGEYPGRDET